MQSRLHVPTFKELCKEITTIEDLMVWYCNNKISWPNDDSDYFKWPNDIIKKKIGSCMDHSNFVTLWAREQGMEVLHCHILVFLCCGDKDKDSIWGHTIPLVKPSKINNMYCLFNYFPNHTGTINYFKSIKSFEEQYPKAYTDGCRLATVNPNEKIDFGNLIGPFYVLDNNSSWIYKHVNKKIKQIDYWSYQQKLFDDKYQLGVDEKYYDTYILNHFDANKARNEQLSNAKFALTNTEESIRYSLGDRPAFIIK